MKQPKADKIPVLSLLAGNFHGGDRFGRTASTTRKSVETTLVSEVHDIGDGSGS
jgi:hypothetical protein